VHFVREGIFAAAPGGTPPVCGADAGHPCGGVTRFEYAFQNRQLGQYSAVLSESTSVYGARQDVSTPTVYRLDPYGGALTVERPLAPSRTAVTVTKWDLAHQTKEWETDARGRRVSFGYDASGNLTSRRIALGRLPASGDERQGTDDVVDAAGSAVGESVELWTYEPSFNQVVCHADASGYVTWNSIDSSTGKLLKTTRYANRSSSQTCSRPSGAIGSEVSNEYCGINGACPPGAVKGDLVRTVDATGATEILALDSYGNPQRARGLWPTRGHTRGLNHDLDPARPARLRPLRGIPRSSHHEGDARQRRHGRMDRSHPPLASHASILPSLGHVPGQDSGNGELGQRREMEALTLGRVLAWI